MTDRVDDSLEAQGPGGWRVKVNGERMSTAILAIALVGTLGWGVWAHHEKTNGDLQQLKDHFEVLTYVLSLKQEDREKLNLAMPDSLRAKMRRRRDE